MHFIFPQSVLLYLVFGVFWIFRSLVLVAINLKKMKESLEAEDNFTFYTFTHLGSRVGAVVRAITSHQCGLGSIPGSNAISGFSLCWFSTLLRGFCLGPPLFLPQQKNQPLQLIPTGCKLCSKVTHDPYSGSQRRHSMLSVRPCRAALLLYLRQRLA